MVPLHTTPVTLLLTLFSLTTTTTTAICTDTPVPFHGVERCHEILLLCHRPSVRTKCPRTCGTCTAATPHPTTVVAGTSTAVATPPRRDECVDRTTEKFPLTDGGKAKKCGGWKNQRKCGRAVVKTNCPLTCDDCPAAACEDSVLPFAYAPSRPTKKRKCTFLKGDAKIEKFCKKEVYGENCPKTCGVCGDVCEDSKEKFLYKDKPKTCKNAINNPARFCKTTEFSTNCPKTCDNCGGGTTKPPSKPPTPSPTLFPTTAAPTKRPSGSPSNAPTAFPTPEFCRLKGVVSFPKYDAAPYYGYHSDSLQVTRVGTSKICGPSSTDWGCVHEGKAYIENFEAYYGESTTESASIEDAKSSTFRFKLQHRYGHLETYYEDDHRMVGNLRITSNGEKLGDFSHPKNKNADTHLGEGGGLNGAYGGIVFVDVECNSGCKCTAKKVTPTCPIVADMRFTGTVDGEKEYGYHNDFLVAKKRGKKELCSPGKSTNWCTQKGDAYVWNLKDDAYYDYLEDEHVIIPEAAGGRFEFKIEHFFSGERERYYDGDHEMAGELRMWIDGEERGVFSHEVSQDVDTHVGKKGNLRINPEYRSRKYVDVECDDACECTITTSEEAACRIEVKVAFPKKKDAVFKGYHSDSVSVEKIGEEEKCESGDNLETDWGCEHDGGIAQISNLNGGSFTRTSEKAVIADGLDGNFRFNLHHNFSEEEQNEDYPDDHKMAGTMTLLINDVESGIFSHPKNDNRDTHQPNGSINTDYMGTRYVDVKCDSDCNCDVLDHLPKCEIEAELKFKKFGKDYGYHADYLTVLKKGNIEECNYDNSMSSWGCIHEGDAHVHIHKDDKDKDKDKDKDVNEKETVYIPNAAKSTIEFFVRHYNSYYDNLYDGDYEKPASLTITINGEKSGPYMHPTDVDNGAVSVYVKCTDKCVCVVTGEEL